LIETIIQTITTMSPAFITTAMKIIIISMRRTILQNMLNLIGTIAMMIKTMNAGRLPMTIFPRVDDALAHVFHSMVNLGGPWHRSHRASRPDPLSCPRPRGPCLEPPPSVAGPSFSRMVWSRWVSR